MSNWKQYNLNDIVDLVHGYQFRDTDFVNDGIPVIKISNVKGSDLFLDNLSYVSNERLKEFEDVVINNGDILMSLTGNIGRVVVVRGLNKAMFQNYRVGKFEPIDGRVDKSYLKYLLSDSRLFDQLSQYSNQSAQANFGKQDLNKLKVSIPTDVKTQQKIAKILSTIDGQIEKTEAIIAKYQAVKQGMLQDLFTRGIDVTTGALRPRYEDAPELYKDSPLGMIPRKWEVERLGNYGKFSKGTTISKSSLSAIGINCILYGELYTKYSDYVTSCFSKVQYEIVRGNTPLAKGDILFAGSGETHEEIGKCITYVGDEIAYAGGDIIIFKSKLFNPIFLSFLLNSLDIQKQKAALGQGSTVIHIYPNHLKRLVVKYPSIDEQDKASKIILNIAQNIINSQNELVKLQSLKKGLMSDLLSGKIEVTV